MEDLTAISLFSSGGIGDLAIRAAGFRILVSNELLDDRHRVFEFNYPESKVVSGDIWESVDRIEEETRASLNGRDLTLLYATPPCQGMSKNGRGKLLNAIRAGEKPPFDQRNRLIVPTLDLASRLRPLVVLLENVPEMASTLIADAGNNIIKIVDLIKQKLGPDYHGHAEVVEFADYGVPQRRQRLITVFSRSPVLVEWFKRCGSYLPPISHTSTGSAGTQKWVTVRDVIGEVPALDAHSAISATSEIPFHQVPLLDSMKYWWVSNTPTGRSAFDNQCVVCGNDKNAVHSAQRDRDGINRASRATPLFCQQCGAMLPRPSVERDGTRELMRGYTSAYKRMSFDKPASALTRNLSYACSDNKVHPEQNRVLSLYEAFKIHTIDQYKYDWKRIDGKKVSHKTIREIIGESIPPAGLQVIINHLVEIYHGNADERAQLGPLFQATLCE